MHARGRPKSIDLEEALEAAMRLFWERGYEAVGMDELAESMGMSIATVYAKFKGKQELFLAALDRYEAQKRTYASVALGRQQTARQAFQELLEVSAEQLTRPDQPLGCMLNLALHTCSQPVEPLRSIVYSRRSAIIDAFEERLQTARMHGELSQQHNLNGLARFLASTLQGMSVQAREGATRSDLRLVAAYAMDAWPS